MAFNGSGTFNRIYNWANDKANGVNITASRFDTEDGGFATGLSTCICKDGQQITTAQIPFAVGLSTLAGTAGAPGVAIIGDLTTGIYQSATGAVDITSSGTRVGGFTSTGLNNTVIGSTTKAAGSFTTIVGTSSVSLGANSGTIGSVILNGSTSGSTTIVPNVAASGTLTLPAATDTLTGKATTDVLTNKTYDTAGTGNVFKINGTSITSISGNTAKVVTATGTLTSGNVSKFDANGNIVDATFAYTAPTSWTPVLNFGGGTTGITYSGQTGSYILIGKFLIAEFTIILSSKGSSTGAATITGLPANTASRGLVKLSYFANMSSMTADVSRVDTGSSTITLAVTGAATVAAMDNTNFNNTTEIRGTATYITA